MGTLDALCTAAFVAPSRQVRPASPRPRLNMTKKCAVSMVDVLRFSMLFSCVLLNELEVACVYVLPCRILCSLLQKNCATVPISNHLHKIHKVHCLVVNGVTLCTLYVVNLGICVSFIVIVYYLCYFSGLTRVVIFRE